MLGGFTVDKYSPYKLVVLGLCGSAIANLIIYFNQSYSVIMVAWIFNAMEFGDIKLAYSNYILRGYLHIGYASLDKIYKRLMEQLLIHMTINVQQIHGKILLF